MQEMEINVSCFFISYLLVLHKNDFCRAADNISLWAPSWVNSKSSPLFPGSAAPRRTVSRYCGHATTKGRKCVVHPQKGTSGNLSATNHRYGTAVGATYKGKQREPSNSCKQQQGRSVRLGGLSTISISECVHELHQPWSSACCLFIYKGDLQDIDAEESWWARVQQAALRWGRAETSR